jgi:hypothetical protein
MSPNLQSPHNNNNKWGIDITEFYFKEAETRAEIPM